MKEYGVLMRATRVLLWFCIAHLYIVVCSIVYHVLEGASFAQYQKHHVTRFLLNSIYDQRVINQVKYGGLIRTNQFIESFNKALDVHNQWLQRYQFSSLARTYVFTLSSHTTIGE